MECNRRRFSDKIIDAMPGYLAVQDKDLRIIEANRLLRIDNADGAD